MENRTAQAPAGATYGAVTHLLRLEGALAAATAVLAYRHFDGSWTLFAWLFLLPDLSMLGYLAGRRWGTLCYNAGHTYASPAALALASAALARPALLPLAAIWVAHIGFDRLMGYGLKYPAAFGATHLGWRGRHTIAG